MTPHGGAADELARHRIRESLRESLIVEAAAGTGKTTELVARIVAVLAAGAGTIERIAAVTFTHKAAGELKLRLRQALDEARGAAPHPETRANLERALARLEEASIGTIHSFCAQLLRERPVEAVVDPGFEELQELEAARLFQRAFRRWLERQLEADSPALRRALARMAWPDSWEQSEPLEQLQYAARTLLEWRDFTAPWETRPFARESGIDTLVEAIQEIADLVARARNAGDPLARSMQPVVRIRQWIQRAEAAAPRDYDQLEALLVKLPRDLRKDFRKGAGAYGDGVDRQHLLERREALLLALDYFEQHAAASLAAGLREEMMPLLAGCEALKRAAGKLDFVDLLLKTRDLLRRHRAVRAAFQEKFTHIFVDEFQDTDPLQAEILLLLAADDADQENWLATTPVAGKLFLVGDPKQSIYKFRRADLVLYRAVRDHLVSRGAGFVTLRQSFRSAPAIQSLVNAAFAEEMTGDPAAGQADYVPLEPYAAAIPGQPQVIALPVPRPYGRRGITKTAILESLPGAVVAFTDWLVRESGWRVRDPESGASVPLEARHIAILFRRFVNQGKDLTRDYVRGLEDRGLAHLLVGSRSFHGREEVENLRVALAAIEWPEDELALFATLKGPLFAIPDALLLRFRHRHGRLHIFAPAPEAPGDLAPVFQALATLAELHRRRNRRPFADTVNALLEAARAHAGFVLRPGGHQVLANVSRVADLARSFEAAGGISFRGLVEEMEAQAARAESAEAPVLEEDADGVRLMTVHTAKGLEFPVVILADMSARLAAERPERYIDAGKNLCATRLLRCPPWELLDHAAIEAAREEAEGVRVAYVAATRARDLLVVPAVGDGPWNEGWLRPLNRALYPDRQAWRHPSPAPGCPAFGPSSVLDRPPELERAEELSVRPGRHTAAPGGHEVVWWDPALLGRTSPPLSGLQHEDLLSRDEYGEAARSQERYNAWKARRGQTLSLGAAPRFTLLQPSLAADDPPGPPMEVAHAAAPGPRVRPGGRRFGALLHAVLRDAPLAADRAELERWAELHARMLGATPAETEGAAACALAAWRHPLLAEARGAERLHREFPVVAPFGENGLVEGVLDLAFLRDGIWTIVDFKTDADVEARRRAYERQLRWYAYALRQATGLPARTVLLML
jgi:ATP-dependent exoDNAse (exonuclease V) beta subunit